MARIYDWGKRRYHNVSLIDLGQRGPAPVHARDLPRDQRPSRTNREHKPSNYARAAEVDRRIIAYLRAHPGSTSAEIAAAVGVAMTSFVFRDAIEDLANHDAPLHGTAWRWTLREEWACGD